MPFIVPRLSVQIADPIAVYGIEQAHDASYTESMRDLSRRNPDMDGVRYDLGLDCLMLAPQFSPQDTTLAACTHMGGVWKEGKTRTTGHKTVQQVGPVVNTEWSYAQGTSPDVAIPQGGGIWFVIGKSSPLKGTGAVATIDKDHCYVRLRLMATSQTGYRIVWAYGEGPRVERTDDAGAHWQRMGDIPIGDVSKGAHGTPDLLRFQILRANGKLVFRATADNSVNELSRVVPDLDLIMPIEMTGMNVSAWIQHFPVTFGTGTLTSNAREKQWVNDTEPEVSAVGSVNSHPGSQNAPDGITLSMIDSGSNSTTQYQATLTAQSSNTITPFLTWVQVSIPAIVTLPVSNPVWTEIGYVLGYDLRQDFLRELLTVRRSGHVRARNNPQGTGHGNNGLYANAHGMCAVQILAGLDVYYDDGDNESIWYGCRFRGWLNAESITSPWEWIGELTDRADWELDVPLLTDIQFDGSCIYHTAKALAERAGFLGDWYVPVVDTDGTPITDAWTCDGSTCDPARHIRLGRGTVNNPAFAYTADQTIWQILNDIALKYGFFCGVSSDGRFDFFPFNVAGARTNWNPKQIFSTVPYLDSGMPQLNEFVGVFNKHVSLKETRNDITLAGMDKDWRIFTSHLSDTASIIGNGTCNPPTNFLGRLRPYVDSSSRYYDPVATDYWCAAKFNLLRQPRVWYDPMEVHPQPLFPLDYVGIAANWTLPGDDKFYVGSMQESIETIATYDGAVQVFSMKLFPELVPY